MIQEKNSLASGGGARSEETTNIREIIAHYSDKSKTHELAQAAKIGLIHDTAQYFADHSGADYAPLALGLITQLGAFLGQRSWLTIPEPERQYPKIYGVVIGPSSSGKEQTIGWPSELLRRIEPDWVSGRTLGGISSGEGLAEAIQTMDRDGAVGSPGSALVLLGEMGQLFTQIRRDGSATLPILLRMWDGDGRLQVPTRKDPVQLDKSHVGLLGCTSPQQFQRGFDQSSWESGFGNRFLMSYNSGTKPPSSYSGAPDGLFNRIVLEWSGRLSKLPSGSMQLSSSGRAFWEGIIDSLWEVERSGGDRAGRTRAKVLRIAMIYAISEGSTLINPEHLQAGIAWVDYHHDVVAMLLGSTLGYDPADTIAQFFRDHPHDRLTRSDISSTVFRKNLRAHELDTALRICLQAGKILQLTERRVGRARSRSVIVYEGRE